MGTLTGNRGILFIAAFFICIKSFASGDDTLRTGPVNNPDHPQFQRLQHAIERLSEIQKTGGWPKINTTRKFYLKGQRAIAIRQIKERLRITGDYTPEDTSAVFTDELVAAVQKVQKRFGLKANGVADALLIQLLNVPVESRIQQLQINMERFQNAPAGTGTRLVVNIPEYKLYVYEGQERVFDMDIVVGTEENQTLTFSDEVTNVVFSPYWNVPPRIVEKEILPASRRHKNYLRNNGYEITGYENGLPVIRQKPGPQNSLGQVKFVFPNEYGIYLHDTPMKGLFQYPKRTFSHGCIRLSEPAKLAQYLLRNMPEWTEEKIREAMNSGKEQWVKLPAPVAVSLEYYTAWVDEEGILQLRQDIYGLDRKPANNVAGLKTNSN